MAAPQTGQLTLTASAQVLTTPVNVAAWVLKALATNSGIAYIGPSGVTTANGYPLVPGEEFDYQRNFQNGQVVYPLQPSDISVVGTVGDIVAWFATPTTS